MHDLLIWYLAVEMLGILVMPLTRRAFANLPDSGWTLSKPFAILVLGFVTWLPLVIIPALPYSQGWIIGTLLLLVAGNAAMIRLNRTLGQDIITFVRNHWRYIVASEVLFAGAMWLMGWLRTFNPLAEGTEKFMDQAFLSAIVRTPHLPPPDPWMSGYPINYYYFGHYLLATLAKLLGTSAAVAFNTGIALTAGLATIAFFGVTANVVASITKGGSSTNAINRAIPFGVLAVFVALIGGNLRSFTLWWGNMGSLGAVLTWLFHPATWGTSWGMACEHTVNPPPCWWSPSRAIPNTITEFPSFSFILADLHAHVLTLPYTIMAIGIALNLFRGRARGLATFGEGYSAILPFLGASLGLGCLYAMNGWDLPTYIGLAGLAIAIQQFIAHDRVWSKALWLDIAKATGALFLAAVLIFAPFYIGFNSPGQGIGIVTNSADRTRIGDEVGTNGIMAFVLIGWLLTLVAYWLRRWLTDSMSEPTFLHSFIQSHFLNQNLSHSIIAGEIKSKTALSSPTPEFLDNRAWFLSWRAIGSVTGGLILLTLATATWPGWTLTWGLILAVVAFTLAWDRLHNSVDGLDLLIFPLVLLGVGALLISACEMFYLKDVFAGSLPRINTVFKLYYQVWAVFTIAGVAALSWIIAQIHKPLPTQLISFQPIALTGRIVWLAVIGVLIMTTLAYPLGASHANYPISNNTISNTGTLNALNGSSWIDSDITAIHWLQTHVSGSPIIVEANSQSAEYSPQFARISTFTGLPTILGWQGHEIQWRFNWLQSPAHTAEINRRFSDIDTIYGSGNPATVIQLLHTYHVRYVYVGQLECQTYGDRDHAHPANVIDCGANHNIIGPLTIFQQLTLAGNLKSIYSNDGVTIWQVLK